MEKFPELGPIPSNKFGAVVKLLNEHGGLSRTWEIIHILRSTLTLKVFPKKQGRVRNTTITRAIAWE